jgi:Protein of unknown function (DUF2975)
MENIQKLSIRFSLLFKLLMVLLPLTTILYWSFFPYFRGIGLQVSNTPLELMVASPGNQFYALLVNMIPMMNIVVGLHYLQKLFQNFAKGIVFSILNVNIYRKIGICLFCLAITENVFDSLLTYFVSYNPDNGAHMLSFGIDSAQIIYIVIAGLILVTSHVLREAYQLKLDAQYTI